jgi:hypothetical protein
MGAWDRLRKVGSDVLTRWRSRDPDSYFQYKRRRERERKHAERGREYGERYTAERAADEPQVEAPRDDTGKSE